jgi:hypothetical protein
LRLDHYIERCGWLISDQDARYTGKRHGDHCSLAHPTAKLVGVFGATFSADSDHLKQIACALAGAVLIIK